MKTSKVHSETIVLWAALIFIIVVLIRLIETTPDHPIVGILAGLTFLGLMWLLTGFSLKS